jgi:hypothetical protein
MVSAITSSLPAGTGASATRGSPSLDAQLQTCRSQLEDWVTCPSAKTPEGKEKIRQITDKFDAIKRQMKQTDAAIAQRAPKTAQAAPQHPSAVLEAPSESDPQASLLSVVGKLASGIASGAVPFGAVPVSGTHIDAYA